MQKKGTMSMPAIIALGVLYLIWGSTFLSVRILIDYFPPLFISYGRNFTAGSLLLLWSILGKHWVKMPRKHFQVHVMAGLLFITINNASLAIASAIVPSGFSAVFMALGPLLLVIFFWLEGVKPSFKKMIATLLGLIGIVLMSSQKGLSIPGKSDEFYIGISLLLGAALAWNIAVFRVQSTKANSYHFTQVCAIQMISGSIPLIFISTLKGDLALLHFDQVPMNAWAVFLYLTLIGSLAGFSIFGYLSKECDAATVATFTYVNPVVALILGNWVLNEELHPILLFASFFILLAVVLITTDKTKPVIKS
ncbi:EamA family transporter [Aquirufa aurantiipilula]|uniref:EamA family transporter n=1 Tax=Aquirufa aurantiipilula TaxID=2696561 RepID=UPI001CAA4EFA|nr:EamA family transporter [Aquirufa aurantiipilula]MBZ1325383.1 EamA family transporter [Aquirufa aurantiipilula]